MSEYQYPAEQLEKAKAQLEGSKAQEKDWSTGQAAGSCGPSLEDYAKSLGGKVTGGLAGQAWGGTYPPPPEQHVCPHCGYCPHCGRGGGYVPNYPYPYYPYYPTGPWTITCSTV